MKYLKKRATKKKEMGRLRGEDFVFLKKNVTFR